MDASRGGFDYGAWSIDPVLSEDRDVTGTRPMRRVPVAPTGLVVVGPTPSVLRSSLRGKGDLCTTDGYSPSWASCSQ